MKRFLGFILSVFLGIIAGCDSNVNVIEDQVEPSCVTGDVMDVTDTSAVIECAFKNFSKSDFCGVAVFWDNNEIHFHRDPTDSVEKYLVSPLEPGLEYSYYAFIKSQDKIITGDTLRFMTTDHGVTGKWTCAVDKEGVLSPLYTVTLNEDGTAGTSDTYYSEPGGWSYEDGVLNVTFAKYISATYADRTINISVADPDSPTFGYGKVENSIYDANTLGSSFFSKDIIMTRNRDMCHTGDPEMTDVVSAVVHSTFKDVPEGGECGVYVASGGKGWKVLGDSSKGLQSIIIEDLLPDTEYSYYSYVEYDGKLVVGETCTFKTLPMDLIGTWICTETRSSGSVDSYVLTLGENGEVTSSDPGMPTQTKSWSTKGDQLSISFARYMTNSGTGVLIKVTVDDPCNPTKAVGKSEHWAENFMTGGSTNSYRDIVMTRQP